MLRLPEALYRSVIGLLFWAAAATGAGLSASVEDLPAVQDRASLLEELSTRKAEVASISESEKEIIETLDRLGREENRLQLTLEKIDRELVQIERRMVDLSREKEQLTRAVENRRQYVQARIKVLYREVMGGRVASALSGSILDYARREYALSRIVKADVRLIERHVQDLESLDRVGHDLVSAKEEKSALEERLEIERATLQEESRRRSELLEEVKTQKRLGLAAIASLEDASRLLDEQMKAMEPAGVDFSGKSFKDVQGLLEMPANGIIVTEYGPSQNSDQSAFTFSSGIDIKVDRGEPVRSVFRGSVLFAQWLRGYGNLMIIDHGDHYYTLYAHIHEFFKKEGEWVETNEVIATAGDTGSMIGPSLHFQVRYHDTPVDPSNWFRKGA